MDLADTPQKYNKTHYIGLFFKDCVGALDGTHIDVVVSDVEGQPFQGRKGTKTLNVLASCSFNRLFTFVNVGYQGSAHDITVWRNCLTDPKFEFPHPPLGIPISERVANVEPRAEYSIFDEGRKAQMNVVQNEIAEEIWQSARDIEEEDHQMNTD
uniref:DDE Tnp4 domain-containing protein n=1 Tax=Chenopodium quinoa TaxID=63459 RepID=A0A803N3M2_CHEQI